MITAGTVKFPNKQVASPVSTNFRPPMTAVVLPDTGPARGDTTNTSGAK